MIRAAILTIAVVLPTTHARPQAGKPSEGTPETGQASVVAPFAEVLRLVQDKGWRANFDALCVTFEMPEGVGRCIFKQISIQDTTGRGDPRAINISEFSGPEGSYIFAFHLAPLAGEFFIISPRGELVRAYYRAKGRGYEPLPNDAVMEEFKLDMDYWITNLNRIKTGLDAAPGGRRAPQ